MRSWLGRFLAPLVLVPSVAIAQGAAPGGSAAPPPPPPPGGGAPAPGQPPPPPDKKDGKPEKKAPPPDRQGYSYRDGPKQAPPRRGVRRRASGPVATLPGFEALPDGGSRLFVAVTQEVPVEERKAAGKLTYILKGTHVALWNNTNALVTVHFDTPVSRARLVPHGNDTWFEIELRAATTSTWKMVKTSDKSAMLAVDFPKVTVAGGEKSGAAKEPAAPPPKPAPPPDDKDDGQDSAGD